MSKHIVSDIRHGYGSRKAGTWCQETIFRDTVQMSCHSANLLQEKAGSPTEIHFTIEVIHPTTN
jgi:hypothetical protein